MYGGPPHTFGSAPADSPIRKVFWGCDGADYLQRKSFLGGGTPVFPKMLLGGLSLISSAIYIGPKLHTYFRSWRDSGGPLYLYTVYMWTTY